MLWHPTLSTFRFKSKILDTNEASSGKWLVPIQIPDVGLIWEDIEDAALAGRLLAVKKSTDVLARKIGHHLVCVYCATSDEACVGETLKVLRDLGVDGDLRYKSDKATFESKDQNLYSSREFEDLSPKHF
ncbi:hypothetical protein ACS4RR_021145 [Rhizobium sp. Z1P35]